MKKLTLLALLSLTLAACSQGTTPAAQTYAPVSTVSSTSTAVQAAQDASVEASFNTLSTQALAPQVYLNALHVMGTPAVRAYLKSTFPAPATCTLDWGDGSATTNVTTPSTSRIDTHDHTYASGGSHTLTVTCRDQSGTVLGTASVSITTVATSATFNFETPVAGANNYVDAHTLYAQGFTLTSPYSGTGNVALPIWSGSQSSHNTDGTQSLDPYVLNTVVSDNSAPFSLLSVDVLDFSRGRNGSVTFTGYRPDGSTVTTTITAADAVMTTTFDSTWTNLARVTYIANSSQTALVDNLKLSH